MTISTSPSLENQQRIGTEAATMQDIADALGVTKTTVSKALNDKGRLSAQTREAVLAMAQQLNFQPNQQARTLSNGRNYNTVGLFALLLDLGLGTRKLQLLQHALAQKGFKTPIHVCGMHTAAHEKDSQVEAMASLIAQRPVGIICNTSRLCDEALDGLWRFQEQGGVVTCYDNQVDIDCDQVIFDRSHNTYTATRHLLELGHRDIAFSSGVYVSDPRRVVGYRSALAEFGVEMRDDRLIHGDITGAAAEYNGGINEEIGVRLAHIVLDLKPRPTAIVIVNDQVAAAFIAESLRRGMRVPEDISVVSLDNLPLAAFTSAVPITVVSQPVEEITSGTLDFLLSRIEGNETGPARRLVVQGTLIERQSTAPPGASAPA
jgi:LacI family transcriptional regulator